MQACVLLPKNDKVAVVVLGQALVEDDQLVLQPGPRVFVIHSQMFK